MSIHNVPITIRDYAGADGGGFAIIHLSTCPRVAGVSARDQCAGYEWSACDHRYNTWDSASAERAFRAIWTVPVDVRRCACVVEHDAGLAALHSPESLARDLGTDLDVVLDLVDKLAERNPEARVFTSYVVDGKALLTAEAGAAIRGSVERTKAKSGSVTESASEERVTVDRDLMTSGDPWLRRAWMKQQEAERRCHMAAEVFRTHHDLLNRRVRDFAGRPFNAAGYADEITACLYNHLHGVETIHRLIDEINRTGERLSETRVTGPAHARCIEVVVTDTPENSDGHALIEVVCLLQETVNNFDPRV